MLLKSLQFKKTARKKALKHHRLQGKKFWDLVKIIFSHFVDYNTLMISSFKRELKTFLKNFRNNSIDIISYKLKFNNGKKFYHAFDKKSTNKNMKFLIT